MVAETKQSMNKMFDCMNDAVRTAFDAGRKAQETWFKASREAWQQPGDFNRFFTAGEQVAREWMPVMQKNVECAANAFGTNFRAGMEVFNQAYDMSARPESGSIYETTRRMWDSAFDVARANIDFVTRTTTRTMESAAGMCDCFRPETAGRVDTKTAEGGKNR